MVKYTACICEGGAERVILDLLLDHDKLIFARNELLEEEILESRKGKDFEEKYLRREFKGKITVYRILDSRRENFKISKAYQNKVDVINVITAPEIEMLIICNEGKYQDFAMGPVAALESIKHLGTNGGGFFGANSTTPFENPTVISNIVELLSMMILPGA